MLCVKVLKEEFQCRNFNFRHERPEDFHQCQWNWHPAVHLSVRMLLTLYITVTLVYHLANGNMNILYLTTWCYIVLALHMLVSTCLSIYGVVKQTDKTPTQSVSVLELTEFDYSSSEVIQMETIPTSSCGNGISVSVSTSPQEPSEVDDRHSIPVVAILSWILSDVISVFAPLVTLVYWSVIHSSVDTSDVSSIVIYKEVNVHALNSVFILIELFISARPVRLLHVIYPAIFGCIYTLFAVIYWLQDKQNHVLYNILNFNHPSVAGVLCLVVIGILCLQLINYGLYRIKICLKHHLS